MFEHQIDSPMQTAVSPCKQRTPKSDLTYTCQNQTAILPEYPDLEQIIEVWPQLSEEMKKAIIKMIS